MTGMDLFAGLSFIDERFIDEAEHGRPPMAFPWLRVASLAACLCLILLCIQPLLTDPQGTVSPTTVPYLQPEGFTEVIVYVEEMTEDGFRATVAELVTPDLFEIGLELTVVFEEGTWYERADGSSGIIEDQLPDFSGCYVLLVCTEYDPDTAYVAVDTIWEAAPPEATHQKG